MREVRTPDNTTGIGPTPDELGLVTDLYELTMAQAYWVERMHQPAVFSLFFRKMPASRNIILACGQEHAARLACDIRFPRTQLDRLAQTGMLRDDFLRWLEEFHFSGDIRCVPEGTPVFPHEPLLEIQASVIEGQLLETLLMNYINLETVLASKALRVCLAAGDRPVLDFGMRRMHGLDAALRSVRAYRTAGIAGTSNVLGALRHDLPARGTMAHSFVQACQSEEDAFRTFARLYPGTVLLIDTYDTLAALDKVIRLVQDEDLEVGGVRLDSGDLGALARECRRRLDAAGLPGIRIVVSGGLDEWKVRDLVAAGVPIDGFGVGTDMGSSADAPTLDLAYKLTEYDGEPRLKNSPGKQLVPGAKQVWRFADSAGGHWTHDEITLRHEIRAAEPLLRPVVEDGAIVAGAESAEAAQQRVQDSLTHLPGTLLALEKSPVVYPVTFSSAALDLREQALKATLPAE